MGLIHKTVLGWQQKSTENILNGILSAHHDRLMPFPDWASKTKNIKCWFFFQYSVSSVTRCGKWVFSHISSCKWWWHSMSSIRQKWSPITRSTSHIWWQEISSTYCHYHLSPPTNQAIADTLLPSKKWIWLHRTTHFQKALLRRKTIYALYYL